MEESERPLLAITLGDPAGIGPEVILKSLQHAEIYQVCRPLVIGDREVLERAAGWIDSPPLQFDLVTEPEKGVFQPGILSLINLANAQPDECCPGRISEAAGRAAVEYVELACNLCMQGSVDAMVTAPINKDAIRKSGSPYPGHTEILQAQTRSKKVGMLLVGENLRILHVSTHLSLQDAIRKVTKERVLEVILMAQDACQMLGLETQRIAVAGLNPHAGEGGLFGKEEQDEIIPAIQQARALGLHISDPQPPDIVFLKAKNGVYDVVVAMYHDQGHIPMKLLAFDQGVNVSVGLPIIRTSVDHGTAFDIAGTGKAKESSMIAAILLATQLTHAKRNNPPASL